MSRKQQGQLETTTLRGVRANSPAHGGSTERKRGVSMLVRGLILTTDVHRRFSLTLELFWNAVCTSMFALSLEEVVFTVVQVVVKT